MTDPNDLIERLEVLKANGLRSISMEKGAGDVGISDVAQAIRKLVEERDAALRECSTYAREAGLATGKLEASEAAGTVELWKDHASRLRALLDEAVGVVEECAMDLDRLNDKFGYENDNTTPKDWSEWVEARSSASKARDFISKVKDQAT